MRAPERKTNKCKTIDYSSRSPLSNLVLIMKSVKTNVSEAASNQTTISDGKGGRIYL